MTKDIRGKLQLHLERGISTEVDVVYLLAEIRKILEKDDPDHQQETLWMYCHWALHVDLDSPKTTEGFLEKVDRWITHTVAYLTPRGSWNFGEEYNLFKDFVFLNSFRHQLRVFLAAYRLPTALCADDDKWHQFVEAYAGVIEDGTLSINSKKKALSAVEVVTFTKGDELSSEHHVPFVIRWTVLLKDGRTVTASLETVPSFEGKMTLHNLQVHNNNFSPPYLWPPSPPPQP